MNPLKTALDCNRSVFIQACAGAGKTFALTKRYAAILDSFYQECLSAGKIEVSGPKNILVITFTKKAAGEMKERILKDVNTLLAGKVIKDIGFEFCSNLRAKGSEAQEAYKKDLRDNFSQNAISTIDSFCAGVLREFAYKLGLDPQFLSQDDHDAKKLLNENLDIWIANKLKDHPGHFDALLDELAFYQIKDILKSMYGSREILDDYLKDFETKSEKEIWRDWLSRYMAVVDVETLAVRFSAIWKEAQDTCKDKNDKLYILLQEIAQGISALDKDGHPLDYRSEFLSVLKSTALFTAKNEYRKSLPGAKGNWINGKTFAEDWVEILKLTPAEEIFQSPGPKDKTIIPLLKELIAKFRDFDDFYLKIRMDRDLLDFSDVIILTHKLLSENPDVCNILGKRYRHILLDEFQDTNPLRWQIIEMIINANPEIKLFVVGDRKQSIYRFNNADVTVMDKAEEKVKELGGESLDFNDNYRSSQIFIEEAVNPLMSMILKAVGDKKEDYEADFAPTASPIHKDGISPALETIWCDDDKESEEYLSAYHCAYQVERLLKEHENTDIDPGEEKPLIAVLLRRYTKLSDYIQAFGKRDIPVSILGGKDFYHSPAMKDVFYLLSILDNPRDDHALIGLLRSPFFTVPDPIIHQLADRKNSVFDAMGEIPELQSDYREILSWIQRSKTLALDLLIAQIIDEKDIEFGYVSELLPEQQLANLDKAINIIRGLQRSGSTLREIREFLHYQISTEADEAQAVYPAKARVQLLTVHKAKGLEYPIVVIPEMNQKGRGDTDKFRYGRYAGHHEISLSLPEDEKPGLLMRLKEVTKNEEDAEDKRVFYVALTRAIYKAVLLGEGEKATKNTWWTKYALGEGEKGREGDGETLNPDNWGENICRIGKEQVLNISHTEIPETVEWKNKRQFEEPGKYLYRSPHDLMGQEETFDFSNMESGLGTAPGKIFHYCMEMGWLDSEKYAVDIKEYIKTCYPEFSAKDLEEKIKPWLKNISTHKLSDILLNPEVEKYPELKIKAWLGNDKDIVQINGVIDLLYKNDGEWVILDYKTDGSQRLLNDYKRQLRSYQWMVKQAYGIDAKAQIYYACLNELVEVEADERYFEKLPLGLDLKAQLPRAKSILGKMKEVIKEGPHLILCASGQHEEQVLLALVREGLMRPDIKVSTLGKFLQEGAESGISQDSLRLMIKHKNPGMKDGTADHLAKALRNEELGKGRVKQEFRKLYHDVNSREDYRPADVPYRQAMANAERIILVDVHVQTQLEEELIVRLKHECELVEISLMSEAVAGERTLIEAFSPREEVMACAAHIKENVTAGEQVMIAVASMEKYATHLQRMLPQYDLRARFIGDRSMFELPVSGLLIDFLNLCVMPQPEWQDMASVLLHPLMKPAGDLFYYDQLLRKDSFKEHVLPHKAVDLYKLADVKKVEHLAKALTAFTAELKKDADADVLRACDKCTELLEKVVADLQAIAPKVSLYDVQKEMTTRIKKLGLPRRDQWNGIPVVGLLDSLGSQVDKLYVLGMVEGDIPRQESENPFFIKNRDYTLELNRHFMHSWKKLGDSVVFCTSTHAEDGSEQTRSSFLEGMKLKVLKEGSGSRRNTLLAYSGKKVAGRNNKLVDRHHEILNKAKGVFSGDVGLAQSEYDISVTQVDTLLKCPMRFYFDNMLKCRPMDQDENLLWGAKKGNVIHHTYEAFIKADGYALDEDVALELMEKCLSKALDEEGIDKDDAQQMDRFRYYVKNLYAGSEKNCLVKNLDEIRNKYSDYTQFESEKAFAGLDIEHPELDVKVRGRIDKIMLDEKNKKLIAADFKTGSIKTTHLSKFMLSQLYLYLKACAREYPEYEMKAMYEKLKEPKDAKMLEYILSEEEFKQGKKQFFIIREFEEHLHAIFSQIGAGKYYITEKPYKDACEHCGYAGICRRDTRLK